MGLPAPEVARARNRVAGLQRHGRRDPDDPALTNAKRDLQAAKLADYIERVLAAAPPLSAEQRSKLAELLKPVRA